MPIGIICEYNPFHNGHAYQIREAKIKAAAMGLSDTRVIAVMSGNFVQRGCPSIVDKFTRTRMALLGGASLVMELPTLFSTATAEKFAFGAIRLLQASGIVDAISFGIESVKDLPVLEKAAELLEPETPEISELIVNGMNDGLPFALARQKAVEHILGCPLPVKPNQILALEYLKALRKLDFHVPVIPIERKGAEHDSQLAQTTQEGTFSSASALRSQLILDGKLPATSELSVPRSTLELLAPPYCSENSLWPFLQVNLAFHSEDTLKAIDGISEGLEHRILDAASLAMDYQDLFNRVRSKRYPDSRIRRILLNIALGITIDAKDRLHFDEGPQYIRILGCKNEDIDLLSAISASCLLPLLVRSVRDKEKLPGIAREAFDQELRFSRIYHAMVPSFPADELSQGLIRL